MPRPPSLAVALALACLTAPAASGAQTQITSRAAFLARFTLTGSNNFEGIAIPADPGSLSVVPTLNFGITTGTLSDPNYDSSDPNAFATQTLGPASSTNAGAGTVFVVADGGISRFLFAGPLSGFGANLFNAAGADDVMFGFFLGGASVGSSTLALQPTASGYTGFLGFDVGRNFDRVDIMSASGEYFELDAPTVGVGVAAVPEPATVALVGAGVLALAARRRRPNRPAFTPESRDA